MAQDGTLSDAEMREHNAQHWRPIMTSLPWWRFLWRDFQAQTSYEWLLLMCFPSLATTITKQGVPQAQHKKLPKDLMKNKRRELELPGVLWLRSLQCVAVFCFEIKIRHHRRMRFLSEYTFCGLRWEARHPLKGIRGSVKSVQHFFPAPSRTAALNVRVFWITKRQLLSMRYRSIYYLHHVIIERLWCHKVKSWKLKARNATDVALRDATSSEPLL